MASVVVSDALSVDEPNKFDELIDAAAVRTQWINLTQQRSRNRSITSINIVVGHLMNKCAEYALRVCARARARALFIAFIIAIWSFCMRCDISVLILLMNDSLNWHIRSMRCQYFLLLVATEEDAVWSSENPPKLNECWTRLHQNIPCDRWLGNFDRFEIE